MCAMPRPLTLTAVLVFSVLGAPRAQQQQQTPATPAAPATPAPPPRSLVPVAASSLADNPDAFYGQYVAMSASVEQTVSKLAFTVDQDRRKSTGKEVLVLARFMAGTVDPNSAITVVGDVVRVDAEELATKSKYTLDLPPDVLEKWRGRPAVLAANIVNSFGIDVTRRLPPPMTAEEEAHSAIMKQVQAANGALRKGIDGSDTAVTKQNTATLAKAFADVEAFWKKASKADATLWAQDARKAIAAIDKATSGGNWEAVKTSAGALANTCQACHAVYRERFDDGTYRIKR
jgi:cytochrome c556